MCLFYLMVCLASPIWMELIFCLMSFLLIWYVLCSGEKTSVKDWPGFLEIKGRVRLDAFEKFLQELPMSRSRAVMVSQVPLVLQGLYNVCLVDHACKKSNETPPLPNKEKWTKRKMNERNSILCCCLNFILSRSCSVAISYVICVSCLSMWIWRAQWSGSGHMCHASHLCIEW